MASSNITKEESTLPIFIADAFTNKPFKGNGAAVCLLGFKQVVPADVKQKIAAEMNLSETAFVSALQDGDDAFQRGNRFALQWFTPKCEVSLCGHATLASAAVLFFACNNRCPVLQFETASGVLEAKRSEETKIEIDLPAYQSRPADPGSVEAVIKAAVGHLPVQDAVISESGNLLVRLKDHVTRDELEALTPRDHELLEGARDLLGVIVTLKGRDYCDEEGVAYDFLSRYFAPWLGVSEDPVTGSAHSVLGPYWSKILNKKQLYARQCSARGGDLNVRLTEEGRRVAIQGDAVVVLRGKIRSSP